VSFIHRTPSIDTTRIAARRRIRGAGPNTVPSVLACAHPRGAELTELARQPNDLLALRQPSCGAQMAIMQRDRRIASAGLSAASASDMPRE
jgi:hypothetical protein